MFFHLPFHSKLSHAQISPFPHTCEPKKCKNILCTENRAYSRNPAAIHLKFQKKKIIQTPKFKIISPPENEQEK